MDGIKQRRGEKLERFETLYIFIWQLHAHSRTPQNTFSFCVCIENKIQWTLNVHSCILQQDLIFLECSPLSSKRCENVWDVLTWRTCKIDVCSQGGGPRHTWTVELSIGIYFRTYSLFQTGTQGDFLTSWKVWTIITGSRELHVLLKSP